MYIYIYIYIYYFFLYIYINEGTKAGGTKLKTCILASGAPQPNKLRSPNRFKITEKTIPDFQGVLAFDSRGPQRVPRRRTWGLWCLETSKSVTRLAKRGSESKKKIEVRTVFLAQSLMLSLNDFVWCVVVHIGRSSRIRTVCPDTSAQSLMSLLIFVCLRLLIWAVPLGYGPFAPLKYILC